jgi:hypothetical protein
MNRNEYERLIEQHAHQFAANQTDDPMLDFERLDGRLTFAIMMHDFRHEPLVAIKLLQSIVREVQTHLSQASEQDVRCLVQGLILLAKWRWQLDQQIIPAFATFERAQELVDQYHTLAQFTHRIFYEKCLIMIENEQTEYVLKLAFELFDSFETYRAKAIDKKMFYVHLIIATIAHRERMDDIAVKQLWDAFRHVGEQNERVIRQMRNLFHKRKKDMLACYYLMNEFLDSYI